MQNDSISDFVFIYMWKPQRGSLFGCTMCGKYVGSVIFGTLFISLVQFISARGQIVCGADLYFAGHRHFLLQLFAPTDGEGLVGKLGGLGHDPIGLAHGSVELASVAIVLDNADARALHLGHALRNVKLEQVLLPGQSPVDAHENFAPDKVAPPAGRQEEGRVPVKPERKTRSKGTGVRSHCNTWVFQVVPVYLIARHLSNIKFKTCLYFSHLYFNPFVPMTSTVVVLQLWILISILFLLITAISNWGFRSV